MVSGTIGEETAVEAMRAGADDYLMKQNLVRLAPAIDRALREAGERRERRRLADQLAQASKIEALGKLAGGIAHDFNNILTVIQGFADLLRMKLAETDSESREDALEILKAAERGAALTSQLLAFSRKQILQLRPLDLNAIIADLTTMLRRLIGENVAMDLQLDPELRFVVGDRHQLEQVLVNLSINARDAMNGRGTLTIATHNGVDGKVRLAVADTGTGMDEVTRARLFEPFFTTKGPQKGTGLGLATVYGIVTQCGGVIEVESEPGNGSRFLIDLPAASCAAWTERDLAEADVHWEPAPDGRILVVEDEPVVRKLLVRLLEKSGHRVLATGSPDDAVRMFAASPDVTLLISDVGLPGRTGTALARELAAERPALRVLLVSAYVDQIDELERSGFIAIPKPLSKKALLEAIERARTCP